MEEAIPLSGINYGERLWSGEPAHAGSPERTGTVFSSGINLAACALGASMLSLPYAMSIAGPVIAIVFLVVFGCMAFLAAQFVLGAGVICQKSGYAAIIRHYFGPFYGSLMDALLAIALAVAAISYIVGLAELLPVRVLPLPSPISVDVSLSAIMLFTLHFLTLVTSGPNPRWFTFCSCRLGYNSFHRQFHSCIAHHTHCGHTVSADARYVLGFIWAGFRDCNFRLLYSHANVGRTSTYFIRLAISTDTCMDLDSMGWSCI